MNVLRKRLLGLEGPYADIRNAIDALDNVKLWAQSLNGPQRHDLFIDLLSLLKDDDIEVATAAVLAMDFVCDEFDAECASAALQNDLAKLIRSPIRLQTTTHGSILEEFFSRLCKNCPNLDKQFLEDFLTNRSPQELRNSLYTFLIPNYAPLAVYHARRLLTHDNAHVIASLPLHWQRIAIASALRPYPTTALERVTRILRLKNANAKDIDAIANVMSEHAPKITHPTGLIDSRKWWIIAAEPYHWTLWETDDNTTAIEVHLPGIEYQSTSRILSGPEATSFRAHRYQ
jgi:hypothetical protein